MIKMMQLSLVLGTAISSVLALNAQELCYDESPREWPVFALPKEFLGPEPTPDDIALADWCQQVSNVISVRLENLAPWNRDFPRSSYTFIVSKEGKITDAFLFDGPHQPSVALILQEIRKSGALPIPPKTLNDRRLKVDLAFPKVILSVDCNEHPELKRERHLFFDTIRKKYPS